MACETCGYRSDTQGMLKSQERIKEPLPEFEVCPECEMNGQDGVAERVETGACAAAHVEKRPLRGGGYFH